MARQEALGAVGLSWLSAFIGGPSQAGYPGQVPLGPQLPEDPLGCCQGLIRLGLAVGQHGWRRLPIEDGQMIEGLAQLIAGAGPLDNVPALKERAFGLCPLSADDVCLSKDSAAKGLCQGSVSANGEGDGSAGIGKSAVKLAQFQVGLGQAGVRLG